MNNPKKSFPNPLPPFDKLIEQKRLAFSSLYRFKVGRYYFDVPQELIERLDPKQEKTLVVFDTSNGAATMKTEVTLEELCKTEYEISLPDVKFKQLAWLLHYKKAFLVVQEQKQRMMVIPNKPETVEKAEHQSL